MGISVRGHLNSTARGGMDPRPMVGHEGPRIAGPRQVDRRGQTLAHRGAALFMRGPRPPKIPRDSTRHVHVTSVGMLLLVLVPLAGCGEMARPPQPPSSLPETGRPTPTSESMSSSASATVSVSARPTSRARPQPHWIWTLLGSTPADRGCTGAPTFRIGSADNRIVVERLQSVDICFVGPGRFAAPEVRVTSPSGRGLSMSTRRDGNAIRWHIQAAYAGSELSELGTYRFRISTPRVIVDVPSASATANPRASASADGSPSAAGIRVPQMVSTTGTVTIRTTTTERFMAVWERRQVVVGGLAPGATIYASVYRMSHGSDPAGRFIEFFQDLPPTRVNSLTEAVISWRPSRKLAPGTYVLWMENGPRRCRAAQPECVFVTVWT